MSVGNQFACKPGRRHNFDYYSGWCANGCGVREDGRTTDRSGVIRNSGPVYRDVELTIFRDRHARRTPYQKPDE